MSSNRPVQVGVAPAFLKALKRLRKKYLRIQEDVEPLIEQLSEGETPGDQVQGTGYSVYKVRLPNRDASRGKSGGYRVIYYVRTKISVILLTIYSKSEQSGIDATEIQTIVAEIPDSDDE
jgi:mRNA-degrading endonuclease RelE of RelBE toxin-antitoxin system